MLERQARGGPRELRSLALVLLLCVYACACAKHDTPSPSPTTDPSSSTIVSTLDVGSLEDIDPPGVEREPDTVHNTAEPKSEQASYRAWGFTAGDDANAATAARTLYDAAVAEGWSDDGFVDDAANGLNVSVLTKDAMTFTLSFVTTDAASESDLIGDYSSGPRVDVMIRMDIGA